MPKETQFNVKEKLHIALNLFWRQGYHATSMNDIKEHMNLNPGSIYSAYGNKRELYLQCLNLYEDNVDRLFENLRKNSSPKGRILQLFQSIIDEVTNSQDCQGCFMLNSALELAPKDREVQLLVDKATLKMRSFFCEEILKAQQQKEVSSQVDATALSKMLILLLFGMRVRSRSHPPQEELESALKQVSDLLSP